MNIFNKVTLQSMKKSRTRTIVTIVGVILSAAMITAVATFAVSLQNYMVKGAIAKCGEWHVQFLNVDSAFVQQRRLDKGVASTAAIENIGYAALEGGQNPNKPYLFVAGFDEEAFNALPITLISGRLPQNSSEIVVPAHVAANGGVKFSLGDTLNLAVGNRIQGSDTLSQHDPYAAGAEALVASPHKAYTVVGICQRPVFEEYSAPGYTLITAADPASEADNFSVFIALARPFQVHGYASDTAAGHAAVFNNEVLRFMGLSDDSVDAVFNALLYSIGGVLIALIMVGSVFLIYNSFNISLNERTRQFGILSSVGATAKQLRNSVLFEGLCIGAVGIPLGVAVGIASIRLVISVVAANFGNVLYSTVPLTLTVSIPAIIAAAAVSLITVLISAYIPARKAANTPVMENIRQTNVVKLDSGSVKTSRFAQRIYGLEGTLALKNFKRNKKRYRSIVLSLTLSVVLFVAATAFGSNLKQATEQSVVTVDYDLCFATENMAESEVFDLYDQLKTADGVYSSSYQAILTYSCWVTASDFQNSYREFAGYSSLTQTDALSLAIQFIEDSDYLRFLETLGLPASEYTGDDAKLTAVAKARLPGGETGETELHDMFASRAMSFWATPETGDEAEQQGQTLDLTFVDTIPLDTLPRTSSAPKSTVFMVVAPYSLKERFLVSGQLQELGLTFLSHNAAQSAAQMEAMVQGAGVTAEYSLHNVYKALEENRNIIFIVNMFTYVFVGMISLIAIANVFNTISTNIKLRRRELAMLRSVGMSDRDFQKMMNFECAFYGMQTLLFGLSIAGGLSWLIYKGLVAGGMNIAFAFPWGSMAISTFSVFLVVFITMLYAIGKIKKENIIDALRDDMT